MTFILSNVRQRETAEGYAVKADIRNGEAVDRLTFLRFGNHPRLGEWVPRLDPFLVTLLMPAMMAGKDIVVEGTIERSLLAAARASIQATLQLLDPSWQRIRIDAEPGDPSPVAGGQQLGAATGMSCGIDSLYTHACLLDDAATPAHLQPSLFLHNHVGAHPDSTTFDRHRKNAIAYADKSNLPLVSVVADMSRYYRGRFIHSHTMRNIAAAMTVDHLFGAFVYSSSEEIGRTPKLSRSTGISTLDPTLVPQFSSQSKIWLPFGFHATRIDKAGIVIDMAAAREHLTICTHASAPESKFLNCGQCYKCAQFLAFADANRKIDAFADVFDLRAFRDNRNKILFRFLRHSIGDRRSITDLRFLAYLDRSGYPLPSWLSAFLPLVRRRARNLGGSRS